QTDFSRFSDPSIFQQPSVMLVSEHTDRQAGGERTAPAPKSSRMNSCLEGPKRGILQAMFLSAAHRPISLLGPRLLGGLTLVSAIALCSSVAAQSAPVSAPAPAPQTKASLSTNGTTSKPATAKPAAKTAAPKNTEIKRDPEGIKGISPYWEAINRGDAQFAAQNFEGAAQEYRSAITKKPKNPLG